MRQKQLPWNRQPSNHNQRQSAASRESAFLSDVFYTSHWARGLGAASIGPVVDLATTRPVGALEFSEPFSFFFCSPACGWFFF